MNDYNKLIGFVGDEGEIIVFVSELMIIRLLTDNQFLTLSSTLILDNVFFILRAVRRATGLGYQHSFITFAILCSTSEACHRFGMLGRILSMHTTWKHQKKNQFIEIFLLHIKMFFLLVHFLYLFQIAILLKC